MSCANPPRRIGLHFLDAIMALCAACDQLARTLSTDSPLGRMYHSEAARLIDSARTCRLCKWMISCIGSPVFEIVDDFEPYSVEKRLHEDPGYWGPLEYRILEIADGQPYRCYVAMESTSNNRTNIGFEGYPWATERSPASRTFSTIAPTTNSASTVSRVASFWGTCRSDHEECKYTISGEHVSESDGPTLPSRIIDVGDDLDSHVRVIDSNGKCGLYCALSHCWGPPSRKPLQTTHRTLASHMQGIEFERLPKTFQDAIVVTRGIGVRYLWIDSLCIVQDDEQDWTKEVRVMGKVYARATLTIAASGAQDSTVGCFISKSHCLHAESIPYYSESQDTLPDGYFYMQQMFDTRPEFGPLQQRGWSFQEWRLSRRTVHFTRGGMSWKCRHHEIDEYGMALDMSQHEDWNGFLTNYTRAEFTLQKDRLFALQGIAAEMQLVRNDSYQFGIWTDDLPEQLLGMRESTLTEGLLDAPSWSWASKLGRVGFWGMLDVARNNLHREISPDLITIEASGTMRIRNAYIRKCEIWEDTSSASSSISTAGLDRDELIYDGYVDAEVEINKAIIEEYCDEGHKDSQYLHGMERTTGGPFGVARLDEEVDSELYRVALVQDPRPKYAWPETTTRWWTLLLREESVLTSGTPQFRRVGMGISTTGPGDVQWCRWESISII